MAHPYHKAAHKNDPKWMGGVRKYADGGEVKIRRLEEPSGLPPYLKGPNSNPPPRPIKMIDDE